VEFGVTRAVGIDVQLWLGSTQRYRVPIRQPGEVHVTRAVYLD
jgi:hypothetical protein